MAKETIKDEGTIQDGAPSTEVKTSAATVNQKPIDPATDELHGLDHRAILTENRLLKAENEELKAALGKSNAPQPITKEFKYEGKKYRFADGHKQIRVQGLGLISSEGLLDIASGKKPSKELLEAFPSLQGIDKDQATQHLGNLVDLGYGYFNEVTKKTE